MLKDDVDVGRGFRQSKIAIDGNQFVQSNVGFKGGLLQVAAERCLADQVLRQAIDAGLVPDHAGDQD
jgi:hypothetical protein